MSNRGSTYVGIVVSILILGAVSSIGYYQIEVAPGLVSTSATTSETTTTAACTPSTCINITIVAGASSPPNCFSASSGCGTNYLYGYSPDDITLVIGVNNTVIWTNKDNPAIHTASSEPGDPVTWDSGCIGSNCPTPTADYMYTFTVPGTYYYHCDYHTWMEGEIVVKQATTTTVSSTTTTTSATYGVVT